MVFKNKFKEIDSGDITTEVNLSITRDLFAKGEWGMTGGRRFFEAGWSYNPTTGQGTVYDAVWLYAVGGTSIILSAANGADIKVLNMYSRAPKAFCLYTKDDGLNSPESLRGKIIAGPAGTNLHELLVAYLNTAGMTIEDVNYVSMSIPEAKAALDGGSADVAMLGGAAAYNAGKAGYHLITNGDGLIQAIIAVAVTQEYYDAHPDVIAKITEAEEAVMARIEADPEAAYATTGEYLDLDVDAVKEMAEYYDFSLEISEEDIAGFQKTADFMYSSEMIEDPFDVSVLFFD